MGPRGGKYVKNDFGEFLPLSNLMNRNATTCRGLLEKVKLFKPERYVSMDRHGNIKEAYDISEIRFNPQYPLTLILMAGKMMISVGFNRPQCLSELTMGRDENGVKTLFSH
jgi:hypothetical protein